MPAKTNPAPANPAKVDSSAKVDPTKPAQGVNPGEQASEGKSAKRKPRPKIDKTQWGTKDADGNPTTELEWAKGADIKVVAPGYDEKQHEPLVRAYFKTTADYLQYRADVYAAKAVQMQKAADDERSGVGKETKAKQKKFAKLAEGYAALKKELEAAGVDISALLQAVEK